MKKKSKKRLIRTTNNLRVIWSRHVTRLVLFAHKNIYICMSRTISVKKEKKKQTLNLFKATKETKLVNWTTVQSKQAVLRFSFFRVFFGVHGI